MSDIWITYLFEDIQHRIDQERFKVRCYEQDVIGALSYPENVEWCEARGLHVSPGEDYVDIEWGGDISDFSLETR